MTHLAAVRPVLAPHRYEQREITEAARALLPDGDAALLSRVHSAARVDARHTALPLESYPRLDGFGEANDAFIAAAVDLGEAAVTGALADAGLPAEAVDLLVYVSTTGLAVPPVDARLMNRLPLRPDLRRLPLFGLGCVAGAAGTARLHDYLHGRPGHTAVLLSVELCSLTFQHADASPANLVGTALFGDGAAALVARGGEAPPGLPTVVDSRSRFYPGTERAMGWDVGDDGFRIVLDPGIPGIVRRHLATDVEKFLAAHGLTVRDIGAWVCHPGGPKVLEAITETLGLAADALDPTWRSLADVGNISSASVLHVLDDIQRAAPPPGTWGLMMALGPGFCAELVLLRW